MTLKLKKLAATMTHKAQSMAGRLIVTRLVAGRPPTTKQAKRNAMRTFTAGASCARRSDQEANKCANHFGMRDS